MRIQIFILLFLGLLLKQPIAVSAQDSEFSVGVLLCLTGECAEWGNNSLRGIQLAQEELNQQGGVLSRKIEIKVEDSSEAAGGAGAVTAFQKLAQDKTLQYYIGPTWTTGGLSVAPIAAKNRNIIITSPSLGVAEFNEASDNIFNTWPHDEFASKALAKYAIDKNWNKAAIFSSQQPWESTQGDTFEKEFIHLGGKITSKQEPIPSLSDLKTEALRIKNSSPDVVFLSNFNQMGISAKQLQDVGYKGPLLAILMDESRIKVAAGGLEGAVFARYPDPNETFISNFEKKFGAKPGITADTAYDTLHLYALAINKAGTFDVQVVKNTLQNIIHEGASGSIVFDSKRAVKKSPVFYLVRNSRTEAL